MDNMVSITEANQNFSRVARLADKSGAVVILKNNVPRYLLVEFDAIARAQATADEDVADVARRVLKDSHAAFETPAKQVS
jgi:antitoxin Phd